MNKKYYEHHFFASPSKEQQLGQVFFVFFEIYYLVYLKDRDLLKERKYLFPLIHMLIQMLFDHDQKTLCPKIYHQTIEPNYRTLLPHEIYTCKLAFLNYNDEYVPKDCKKLTFTARKCDVLFTSGTKM